MKQPRTFNQIKSDPRVDEAQYEGEEDGYWVYLKDGYYDYGFDSFNPTKQLHEWNIKRLCDRFASIKKAN